MKTFILYLLLLSPLLSLSQDIAEVVVRGYSIKPLTNWNYTRISAAGKVYILDDEFHDNLSQGNVYFLGDYLTVDIPMVPTAEAAKFIAGRPALKTRDVFQATNLEYRLTFNNVLLKDWTAARDIAECTRDSIQQNLDFLSTKPAFLARNSNNVPILLDYTSVSPAEIREEPVRTLTNIPIENKIILTRKMKLNDSVRIDLRFSNNPMPLRSITATRVPIKPFLSFILTDEVVDQFLTNDPKTMLQFRTINDSSFSPKYLMSKWDSLPSAVTLNFNSSVERVMLQFAVLGDTRDSAFITGFGVEGNKLNPIRISDHRVLLRDLEPGTTYNLSIYYKYQPENSVLYRIIIAPAWYQTNSFRWILGTGVLLLLLGLSYILYAYKLRRQKQHQARIALELKSIRSQLNPHFIFNALSSIQGLINNNEIDKANIYLSEFGSLMRDTLSGNNTNNNTLAAEIKILDRYLQLEQLRFGFKFNINISDKINGSEIEIPSLLLQPIVENAVKHGVSALRNQGKIDIDFEKQGSDLVIRIDDNGKGFSEANGNGYGIKLTRERIQLLNQANNEQPVSFDINSGETGTTVLLSFKNWF